MKSLLLPSLFVLFATSTFAQNSPNHVHPPVAKSNSAQQTVKPADKQLTENITLKLKGAMQGMDDLNLDIEMSGVGPEFMSDFAGNKPNPDDSLPAPIFTIQASVLKVASGYKVNYAVGARVAVTTTASSNSSQGVVSANIQFRDLMVTGTVIVTPGKPLVISKINGKELTLEIIEAE